MTCVNNCPNTADYTLYLDGHEPVHVCQAHLYAYKANAAEGTYRIRPRSLAAHMADYQAKRKGGQVQ